MKCNSVVDLCSLAPCASWKSEANTGVSLTSSTLRQRVRQLPRNGASLMIATIVLLFLLVPSTSAAAMSRQGCHKVASKQIIDEPGCETVEVHVFKCTGRCLSFALPSSDSVLKKNPDQIFTVHAKCCRMIEIKMLTVDLKCSDGQREFEIPSAQECGCFDCGALV